LDGNCTWIGWTNWYYGSNEYRLFQTRIEILLNQKTQASFGCVKEKEITMLLLIYYILCGIFGYGFSFAYFQGKFPVIAEKEYWTDFWMASIVGFFGPFGLIAIVIITIPDVFKYGLKFR
jgi:hypothetical protein